MKCLSHVILLALFIGMALWLDKCNDEAIGQSQKLLQNGIVFTGEVLSAKASNNHAFGVIFLKLKSTNTATFIKSAPKTEFPYKIHGKQAELYTGVSAELMPGDIVTVNSDSLTGYFYHIKSKQRDEGSISIIESPIDIEFINENTKIPPQKI